jgi:hypothetical protein
LVNDPNNLSPSEQARYDREQAMTWEERNRSYQLSVLGKMRRAGSGRSDGEFLSGHRRQADKRYPALRAIASTLQIFATLAIVAGILTVIIATIASGVIGFFMSVIVGGLFFGLLWIGLKSYSELIYVQIDIEANTRQTAEEIQKLTEK